MEHEKDSRNWKSLGVYCFGIKALNDGTEFNYNENIAQNQ